MLTTIFIPEGDARALSGDAKQFIEYIASRSLLTGNDYRVKVSDKESYPLGTALYNELARLG